MSVIFSSDVILSDWASILKIVPEHDYETKVQPVMTNNSTSINAANNHLSFIKQRMLISHFK